MTGYYILGLLLVFALIRWNLNRMMAKVEKMSHREVVGRQRRDDGKDEVALSCGHVLIEGHRREHRHCKKCTETKEAIAGEPE